MNRLAVFGVLFILVNILDRTWTLSCPGKCYEYKDTCPKVYCKYGVGKDVCGCCDACLKGIGEPCGGIWNIKGDCAKGLFCKDNQRYDVNEPGICAHKKKKSLLDKIKHKIHKFKSHFG